MADQQRRLYRVSIPIPNPALREWLTGPQCLRMVEERTAEVFAIYEAMLPIRTTRLNRDPAPGHLKKSAYYRVGRGGFGAEKDRWFGWVGNTADYAAVIEWGSRKRNIPGRHDLKKAGAIVFGEPFEAATGAATKRRAKELTQKKPRRAHRNALTNQERRALATEKRKEKRAEARAKAQRNRELKAEGGKAPKTEEQQKRQEQINARNARARAKRAEKRASEKKLTRSQRAQKEYTTREAFTAPEEIDVAFDADRFDDEQEAYAQKLLEKYDKDPKSISRSDRTLLKEAGLI